MCVVGIADLNINKDKGSSKLKYDEHIVLHTRILISNAI